jgi:hypothetical protein
LDSLTAGVGKKCEGLAVSKQNQHQIKWWLIGTFGTMALDHACSGLPALVEASVEAACHRCGRARFCYRVSRGTQAHCTPKTIFVMVQLSLLWLVWACAQEHEAEKPRNQRQDEAYWLCSQWRVCDASRQVED